MVCGVVIFCKRYKPKRLLKANQEQAENYCKRWKIITEIIKIRFNGKIQHG